MVNGLKLFQEAFENFSNQYILIGGTACDLLLDDVHRRLVEDSKSRQTYSQLAETEDDDDE